MLIFFFANFELLLPEILLRFVYFDIKPKKFNSHYYFSYNSICIVHTFDDKIHKKLYTMPTTLFKFNTSQNSHQTCVFHIKRTNKNFPNGYFLSPYRYDWTQTRCWNNWIRDTNCNLQLLWKLGVYSIVRNEYEKDTRNDNRMQIERKYIADAHGMK